MMSITASRAGLRLRTAFTGVALGLLVFLHGCGPGLGGTGAGTAYVPGDFGAQSGSACLSVLADALRCQPAVPAEPQAFVGLGALSGVTLRLGPTEGRLDASCQGLAFEGSWGILPSGEQAYFGSVVHAEDSGVPQPAWLQVGLADAGGAGSEPALTVTLKTADGRVLLGPFIARRLPAAAAPPASSCG